MKDGNKEELINEELTKFNYRVDYKINETPSYRPLVGMDEVFDEVPNTNEAGDQEDAEKAGGGKVPPAPTNDQPILTDPPVPDFDANPDEPNPLDAPTNGVDAPNDGGNDGVDAPNNVGSSDGLDPMGGAPEEKVDEIQNEIIKHNIEAMKNIHDQLIALNDMSQSLDSKIDKLGVDVEEVREPSNTEKLLNKSEVSYPYYFNLNDLWSDNWFKEKREQESSDGIKELPDGTYVADFDDLPQQSKDNIQDSFNDID